MAKHFRAYSSSQAPEVSPMTSVQRQAQIFDRQLVVERFVSTLDFLEYSFEGRSIHQVLTRQSWERQLSRIGDPYFVIVQEFYTALVDLDIEAEEWEFVLGGVGEGFSYYVNGYCVSVCTLFDWTIVFRLIVRSIVSLVLPSHSIPFSTGDIDIAIPAIDPSDTELPTFLSEYPCAQFLDQYQK
ncbi:Myosin-15 [Morella rubra]|uniref:Myosin-15 n=1 Tax=Morella rubra TaxID=262757 RepID=A0A6A1VKI5_9ROSI|nr:Myosin-15 [Morella rubra]